MRYSYMCRYATAAINVLTYKLVEEMLKNVHSKNATLNELAAWWHSYTNSGHEEQPFDRQLGITFILNIPL